MPKVILLLIASLFLPLTVSSQVEMVRRGDCTPTIDDGNATTRGVRRRLPSLKNQWDANVVYRQMVILIEYSDSTFSRENPREDYDRIFNETGYNEGLGPGCVADYFREQSGGMLNLQFDVYGPYRISKAARVDNPSSSTRNYGRDQMIEATKMCLEDNPDIDYSCYDWNHDGYADQVIYISASLSGNQGANASYGFIWPNTSSFSTVTAPDGTKISDYSVSCEMWTNRMSCGIGTICHEFTHCFGLPDLYPTNGSAYSVVDEWDLMDGGNFTNYGWCPPNFTPMEKILLGWLTPYELTEPTTITNLKPSAEGGEVYCIEHSDNEWLMLENRQQLRWDLGVPGMGLVIYHANYDQSSWSNNKVNTTKGKWCYELVNADNLDYDAWDNLLKNASSQYANKRRMNNKHLCTSPYPLMTDSMIIVNCELTDSSVPHARMNNNNRVGSNQLGKPITNIRMSEDGLVSFDFMGGAPNGILPEMTHRQSVANKVYNLQGQQVEVPRKGIYIIDGKKYIIH